MTPARLPGIPEPPPPPSDAAPPPPSISGANVAALTAGGLALNVALKARGLVVVPLYARLLDPAGLGIVTLGTAIATLLAPFVHLGLPLGMLVELPHRPAGAPFTRGVRAVLGTVAALALLAVLLTPWGLRHGPWPSLAPLAPYGIVVAALAAAMALREAGQAVPQLERQVRFLSGVALLVEFGGAVVGLLLVAAGAGPGGLLAGIALMTAAGALAALGRTIRLCPRATGRDLGFVRAALGVGLPMTAITTAQWVVQSADRFFLLHYEGAAAVGVYSLGYAVAAAVLAVAATLNLVFLPVASNLLRTAPDRLVRLLDEFLRLTIVLLGLCLAGAFVVGAPVMRWLGGARYAAAGDVLPWMVASYSLFTIVQLLQWVPMTLTRRVKGVAAIHGGAAALNLALDLVLIPRYGMRGAVAAAIAAYGIGAVLMAGAARRALPEWSEAAALPPLVLAVAAAAAGGVMRLPEQASLTAVAGATTAVILVYTAGGLAVRAVRAADFTVLRTALAAALARARS